jgi:endonuclease/exonuclease/phosphatase family metal-dependent hydrolase
MALKIITLNIERNRHWELVLPFLERERADVVCLQEIFEDDVERVEALGYHGVFAFIMLYPPDPHDLSHCKPLGVAIFSRTPLQRAEVFTYYAAPSANAPRFPRTPEIVRETTDHRVIVAHIEHSGVEYPIATTHFTLSTRGRSTPEQATDMTNLLTYLSRFPALVLAGDLNIPRGHNKQYERLTERYTDWVPIEIESTIDLSLHRAGRDPKEVPFLSKFTLDYFMSTHQFRIDNVRTKSGVSDHLALIGEVTRSSRL